MSTLWRESRAQWAAGLDFVGEFHLKYQALVLTCFGAPEHREQLGTRGLKSVGENCAVPEGTR